jgi:hypothetical protein
MVGTSPAESAIPAPPGTAGDGAVGEGEEAAAIVGRGGGGTGGRSEKMAGRSRAGKWRGGGGGGGFAMQMLQREGEEMKKEGRNTGTPFFFLLFLFFSFCLSIIIFFIKNHFHSCFQMNGPFKITTNLVLCSVFIFGRKEQPNCIAHLELTSDLFYTRFFLNHVLGISARL